MNLRNIINPLLHLNLDAAGHLKLLEKENIGNNSKLSEVFFMDLPNDIFAYSTDISVRDKHNTERKLYNEYLNVQARSLTKQVSGRPVWIDGQTFTHTPYLDKRADAIIIHQENGKEIDFNILICELKSRDLERTDCEEKFMVEKVFIGYAIDLLRVVFKEKIGKVEIKFAIFYFPIPIPPKGIFFKKNASISGYQVEVMPTFTDCKFIIVPCEKPRQNYFSWHSIINCS